MATLTSGYTLRGSMDSALAPLSVDEITTSRFVLTDRTTHSVAEAYLRGPKGDFVFQNISEGSYILQLEAVLLRAASSFRVDIRPGEVEVYLVLPGHDVETDLGPRAAYPIVIDNINRPVYTVEREKFSLLNMVKSPMMLMSLASLVVVFALPKMAENIDPETLKQFEGHQQRQGEAMDKVTGFDMAGYIAEKRAKN